MNNSNDIFEILYASNCRKDSDGSKYNDYIGPIRVSSAFDRAIGRSLVVTRDVKQGELLFISTPVLRASADQARQLWFNERANDISTFNKRSGSLNDIAETLLVDACISCEDANILQSCMALVGSTHSKSSETSLDVLLGNSCCNDFDMMQKGSESSANEWQQIVRRNAFGADFITTDYVEQRWMADFETHGNDVSTWFRPGRLLSLYPLASMINHSCIPNAVRVFVNNNDGYEFMIVHACQNIQEGEEIFWSYVPVIDSYAIRLKTLKATHNFVCQCERCKAEANSWKTNEYLSKINRNVIKLISSITPNVSEMIPSEMDLIREQVNSLEHDLFLPSNTVVSSSNEVKRYLRVGFFRLYSIYLNGSLLQCQNDEQTDRLKIKNELLNFCTQLHFALAACHNASTEHISVSQFYYS